MAETGALLGIGTALLHSIAHSQWSWNSIFITMGQAHCGLNRHCRWPEDKVFLGQNISLNDQIPALQITFPVPSYIYKSFRHTGEEENPFFFLLFVHRMENIGPISFTSIWSDYLLYTVNCSKEGNLLSVLHLIQIE